MFSHYVITRFNVRIDGMGPEKIISPPLDASWLEERLFYFSRFCVPSLQQQTETNFTWLVYVDAETPAPVLNNLLALRTSLPHLEFLPVVDFAHMLSSLRERMMKSPEPYIITTRLDNDDMVSRTFIASIQAAFRPAPLTVINFNAGYEYDIRLGIVKKWNERFHNQFISLVEQRDTPEILTVYGFPHWRLPEKAGVINLDAPAGWMHLRHRGNYSPDTYKGIPVFSKREVKPFPVEIKISMIQSIRYALAWFPRMVARRWQARKKQSGLPDQD